MRGGPGVRETHQRVSRCAGGSGAYRTPAFFSPGPIRGEEAADMDNVRDVAQIVYYIALSIAGPIALIEFLKARKADRRANEYKIYDELDNRFFEYQKLAL